MQKLFIIATILMFFSCKKVEQLDVVRVSELYPLAVGKSFIYRLDSTQPSSFGASLVTKSFLAKDSVDGAFIDAVGKRSYRIYRYLRDTAQTKPWAFAATYSAHFDSTNVEFVDNSLRFIKLANPVSFNTTWKGNVLINTVLPSPYYFLDNWNYSYESIDEPFTTPQGITYDHTYTVFQEDMQTPAVFSPGQYNAKSYSKEVYAKGIGLVYKEFLYWIWQPTPTPARYQDDAYGVKLSLISYR
jgi:hypothetical protein